MRYFVSYKHTFGGDVIYAKTKKTARRKALKILRKEFTAQEREAIRKGVNVFSCGKKEKIYSLKDLIEKIEKDIDN